MQYNNEIENLDEADVLAEEVVLEEETEKKESFFKKHAFFMGVLTSIICFAIVLAGIKGLLKMTGQLLIIGEAGASTINGDSILSDAAVEKIDEIPRNDFQRVKITKMSWFVVILCLILTVLGILS